MGAARSRLGGGFCVTKDLQGVINQPRGDSMSDSTGKTSQSKPWYKKWWGILIVVCIWPYFFIWFVWSKTKWNKLAKAGATAGFVIAAVISASVLTQGSSTPNQPAPIAKTTPAPTPHSTPSATQVSKPVATPKQKPAVSVASLNAQAVPLLTKETDSYEQLYNNVVVAANKPDAQNSTSDFHQLWDDIEHTTKYDSSTAVYNQASNLYFSANQQQPGSIDDWNGDIQQVYSDIVATTDDQFRLFADQVTGNSTDSDQTKFTQDNTAYKSDLAKARADIKQLN